MISHIKIAKPRPKHLCLLAKKCIHTTCIVNKDYYEVLNIERNSTKKNIKHAYYKLSKMYHPDVNKEADAESRFKEIQEAYHVLGDDSRKIEYDRSMNEGYYERANSASSSRHPFDRRQRSGPARTTTGASDSGPTSYDFNDYYRSHYNDKYRAKTYSSYSSAYSTSSKMSQEELNSYWNKQHFGSHDEIRDAYKRLVYSITFSMIIVLFMISLIDQAIHRERKMALEKADGLKNMK